MWTVDGPDPRRCTATTSAGSRRCPMHPSAWSLLDPPFNIGARAGARNDQSPPAASRAMRVPGLLRLRPRRRGALRYDDTLRRLLGFLQPRLGADPGACWMPRARSTCTPRPPPRPTTAKVALDALFGRGGLASLQRDRVAYDYERARTDAALSTASAATTTIPVGREGLRVEVLYYFADSSAVDRELTWRPGWSPSEGGAGQAAHRRGYDDRADQRRAHGYATQKPEGAATHRPGIQCTGRLGARLLRRRWDDRRGMQQLWTAVRCSSTRARTRSATMRAPTARGHAVRARTAAWSTAGEIGCRLTDMDGAARAREHAGPRGGRAPAAVARSRQPVPGAHEQLDLHAARR